MFFDHLHLRRVLAHVPSKGIVLVLTDPAATDECAFRAQIKQVLALTAFLFAKELLHVLAMNGVSSDEDIIHLHQHDALAFHFTWRSRW